MINISLTDECLSKHTDQVGNSLIHCATYAKNIECLGYLLGRIASFSQNFSNKNLHNNTPVHLAISKDLLNGLKLFRQYEYISFSEIDKDGYTPLHLATLRHNLQAVKLLVKCGLDLNVKTKDGKTALTLALEKKYRKVANYLVLSGARYEIPAEVKQNMNYQYLDDLNSILYNVFNVRNGKNIRFYLL